MWFVRLCEWWLYLVGSVIATIAIVGYIHMWLTDITAAIVCTLILTTLGAFGVIWTAND